MFLSEETLRNPSWQALERLVFRLLKQENVGSVHLVGRSSDGGADILARRADKRWLYQVKNWARPAGNAVVQETLRAIKTYRADVPVIVSLNGFEVGVKEHQHVLQSQGIPLQLWDRRHLIARAARLPDLPLVEQQGSMIRARDYQEAAIEGIVTRWVSGPTRSALCVLATGLGKTFVAAEAMRRIRATRGRLRVLAVAHTNDLVYQLERSFWPMLRPTQETIVWNGHEKPDDVRLQEADFVFACVDTLAGQVERGKGLPEFDAVVVDECHHAGSHTYRRVLSALRAGEPHGPFLLGLTATPWRADNYSLGESFGEPLIVVDLVSGMRRGFLSNVDYRVFTSNIDWTKLSELRGARLTPKAVNRKLFIAEWDDAVVHALKDVWHEQKSPRAIVFCGTIDHARIMRDRINALAFCRAEAIYSGTVGGEKMEPWMRSRVLADFDAGDIDVICAVDIFNEGIDVPDVNILVFQRVTHSRRIFIQQLGRGLRLAPGKEHVIVLDFVSDVRRFAADIDLQRQLERVVPPEPGVKHVRLNSRVRFVRLGEGPDAESFLKQWLDDVTAIEEAGEDSAVLKFPPM